MESHLTGRFFENDDCSKMSGPFYPLLTFFGYALSPEIFSKFQKNRSINMITVFALTTFFWLRQIGALHHGRLRQDIYSNFFEDIDKGWNCGVVGVSIISGNRKCPKKFYTLTLEIIGCERKCDFFHFLLR